MKQILLLEFGQARINRMQHCWPEYGCNEQDLVDEYIEITHWMPMPEPPEEEGTEK